METVVGDLMATELRLGLPGTADETKATVPSAPSTPRGKKRATADAGEDAAAEEASKRDAEAAPPAAKAPVVGWPPVRSYRKSCFQASSKQSTKQQATKEEAVPSSAAASATGGAFVKVSMDGAPYLRKVDLRMYKGYRELREALESLFVSSNNGGANLSEFAVTYEDKDGDLMLVGDVPFE
ncbi:unnamed protein product [Urochloa decumbens]